MQYLTLAEVAQANRKALADLAVSDPVAFAGIVGTAKQGLVA